MRVIGAGDDAGQTMTAWGGATDEVYSAAAAQEERKG